MRWSKRRYIIMYGYEWEYLRDKYWPFVIYSSQDVELVNKYRQSLNNKDKNINLNSNEIIIANETFDNPDLIIEENTKSLLPPNDFVTNEIALINYDDDNQIENYVYDEENIGDENLDDNVLYLSNDSQQSFSMDANENVVKLDHNINLDNEDNSENLAEQLIDNFNDQYLDEFEVASDDFDSEMIVDDIYLNDEYHSLHDINEYDMEKSFNENDQIINDFESNEDYVIQEQDWNDITLDSDNNKIVSDDQNFWDGNQDNIEDKIDAPIIYDVDTFIDNQELDVYSNTEDFSNFNEIENQEYVDDVIDYGSLNLDNMIISENNDSLDENINIDNILESNNEFKSNLEDKEFNDWADIEAEQMEEDLSEFKTIVDNNSKENFLQNFNENDVLENIEESYQRIVDQAVKAIFEKQRSENKIPLTMDLETFKNKLNLEKIKLIDEFNTSTKDHLDQKAIQIMIDAMERNAENVVSTKFSFTIKLTDDSVKGKIIGKDGRNKKTFENITGTDLIIESDQQAITISSPNPIRREIAKQTMEKVLESKNIEPNKIEITYEEIKENFQKKCFEIGREAIENKLKLFDIDKELYETIGILNFRTSYTQNVLKHSIECAILASQIALALNLDPIKAKKAAFFHDIGKAIDFEFDNDHVDCGVKLAKKYKMEEYIINAIESHHDKVIANNPYSAIVKVVDKLSASRPGARLISNDGYFKRIESIEKICRNFNGVKDAYVLKSGKQIRVIVNPDIVDDDQCLILMHELKFKLEENEIINKQPIEIIMFREYVIKSKTSGSATRTKELN